MVLPSMTQRFTSMRFLLFLLVSLLVTTRIDGLTWPYFMRAFGSKSVAIGLCAGKDCTIGSRTSATYTATKPFSSINPLNISMTIRFWKLETKDKLAWVLQDKFSSTDPCSDIDPSTKHSESTGVPVVDDDDQEDRSWDFGFSSAGIYHLCLLASGNGGNGISTRQCSGNPCTATNSLKITINEGSCLPPDVSDGYIIQTNTQVLTMTKFLVTGTCDSGYYGTFTSNPCSKDNGKYSLSGCTPCPAHKPHSSGGEGSLSDICFESCTLPSMDKHPEYNVTNCKDKNQDGHISLSECIVSCKTPDYEAIGSGPQASCNHGSFFTFSGCSLKEKDVSSCNNLVDEGTKSTACTSSTNLNRFDGALVGTGCAPGIYCAEYFANADLAGIPTTVGCLNDVKGGQLSYDWKKAGPSELPNVTNYFSARYSINQLLGSGTFTFSSDSDDGTRIYLDKTQILDKWNSCCSKFSKNVTVKAGVHHIIFEYREKGGNAKAKLSWKSSNESATKASLDVKRLCQPSNSCVDSCSTCSHFLDESSLACGAISKSSCALLSSNMVWCPIPNAVTGLSGSCVSSPCAQSCPGYSVVHESSNQCQPKDESECTKQGKKYCPSEAKAATCVTSCMSCHGYSKDGNTCKSDGSPKNGDDSDNVAKSWVACASQNGTCQCAGGKVRYGRENGLWGGGWSNILKEPVKNTQACSTLSFGDDPTPTFRKKCECYGGNGGIDANGLTLKSSRYQYSFGVLSLQANHKCSIEKGKAWHPYLYNNSWDTTKILNIDFGCFAAPIDLRRDQSFQNEVKITYPLYVRWIADVQIISSGVHSFAMQTAHGSRLLALNSDSGGTNWDVISDQWESCCGNWSVDTLTLSAGTQRLMLETKYTSRVITEVLDDDVLRWGSDTVPVGEVSSRTGLFTEIKTGSKRGTCLRKSGLPADTGYSSEQVDINAGTNVGECIESCAKSKKYCTAAEVSGNKCTLYFAPDIVLVKNSSNGGQDHNGRCFTREGEFSAEDIARSHLNLSPGTSSSWELVFRQTTSSGQLWKSGQLSVGKTGDANFARLDMLEQYRKSNSDPFIFKMKWPSLIGNCVDEKIEYVWGQTSNPAILDTKGKGVTGYDAILAPYTAKGWAGLENNADKKAIMDGSVNSSSYFYAIGVNSLWNHGIPAYVEYVETTKSMRYCVASSTELYVLRHGLWNGRIPISTIPIDNAKQQISLSLFIEFEIIPGVDFNDSELKQYIAHTVAMSLNLPNESVSVAFNDVISPSARRLANNSTENSTGASQNSKDMIVSVLFPSEYAVSTNSVFDLTGDAITDKIKATFAEYKSPLGKPTIIKFGSAEVVESDKNKQDDSIVEKCEMYSSYDLDVKLPTFSCFKSLVKSGDYAAIITIAIAFAFLILLCCCCRCCRRRRIRKKLAKKRRELQEIIRPDAIGDPVVAEEEKKIHVDPQIEAQRWAAGVQGARRINMPDLEMVRVGIAQEIDVGHQRIDGLEAAGLEYDYRVSRNINGGVPETPGQGVSLRVKPIRRSDTRATANNVAGDAQGTGGGTGWAGVSSSGQTYVEDPVVSNADDILSFGSNTRRFNSSRDLGDLETGKDNLRESK